jgi:hypothetical protein
MAPINGALSKDDIRTILRAGDELIGEGGRTLLSKILKVLAKKNCSRGGLLFKVSSVLVSSTND